VSDRSPAAEPSRDCPLCPRLAAFRDEWRAREPTWHNGPVPTFGAERARLLIVGLAPGLRGANRTGRPFTGDYAGELLYSTLLKFGFARGAYRADPADGLALVDAAIVNGVRCVPPQNKPLPVEIATCRKFLESTFAARREAKALVALGRIAHETTLRAFGRKLIAFPFAHGAKHDLGALCLYDSYHCSRYNTNTGVLTTEMFEAVFAKVRADLDAEGRAQA
jgi:uracil-DNA glycosylase